METRIKQSFTLNVSVMRVLALYRPEKTKCLHKVQAYIYLLLIIPVSPLGCLYLILEKDIDLTKVAQNAFMLAEIGCFITKFLPFLLNGHQIKRCIHYFEAPFFRVSQIKHKEIIDECARICRRNSTVYFISVMLGYGSWAAKPLFMQHHVLPIDMWLPFNPTSGPKVYYSVYLFVVIVGYAAVADAVIDPLIAGLACQATSQLKVLKHNLQHLSSSGETSQLISDKIRHCIDHHDAILNFVKEYEECFSLVVFSQFFGSVFVICVSCLQLSMIEPFTYNFYAMVSFIIPIFAEIYLFCYYGTTLCEEGNSLTTAIYMGEWYEYDVASKKALIVLMERSKRPTIVTVLDLSLHTFTTILRRSYSLLAVLNNYK